MKKELPVIRFFKEDHKYLSRDDHRLKSVNQLISEYDSPFEGNYWLLHSAIKDQLPDWKTLRKEKFGHWKPNTEEMLCEMAQYLDYDELFAGIEKYKLEWEAERNRASLQGTEFHDQQEQASYERGYEISPWTEKKYPVIVSEKDYDNQSVADDLSKLEDGFYAELLVFWGPVCGQADKVFIETEGGVRYVDIDDYKTNKKIKTPIFTYFKEPLAHIPSNHVTKYGLAISTYAFILEQWGFQIRNLAFTHYKKYDLETSKIYPLDYYQKEISDIFPRPESPYDHKFILPIQPDF